MKKELFEKRIMDKSVTVINDNSWRLDEYKSLKGFLKYTDFGCNIKSNGTCKVCKEDIKCCCANCLYQMGYFGGGVMTASISYYAKLFSVKTGFWREGKGCVLPHEHRSITCLTHHCNDDWMIATPDKKFSKYMRAYKRKMQDTERELKRADD